MLHELPSPPIWCRLTGWLSSYGQKPLGIPSRKVPWSMVWSCVYLGGVRCCVLCVRQKSVDVEVPKRAIWGGSPQSLLSVSYLHCMVSEYNEGISNSNELERMMQRAAFGGINRYYLLIQRII